MIKITTLFRLIFSFALGMVTLFGCQPGTTSNSPQGTGHHGHSHKHGETYAEALAELDKLRSDIQTNFQEGTAEVAHGSIHEAGHILEEIPALAKKDGISGENFEKVKQAADRAFNAFGKLDTFHGNDQDASQEVDADKVRYEKVAGDIQSAFEDLHAETPATEQNHEHDADHEHDEADNHEHDADHEHDEADHHEDAPKANSTGQEGENEQQGDEPK